DSLALLETRDLVGIGMRQRRDATRCRIQGGLPDRSGLAEGRARGCALQASGARNRIQASMSPSDLVVSCAAVRPALSRRTTALPFVSTSEPSMKYRTLGQTGLKVSELSLG